jgi:hypothetical protein
MTNYSRHSNEATEVTVSGIRDEAKKWHGLSDRMRDVFDHLFNVRVKALSIVDPLKTLPLYPVGEQYSQSFNEYTGLINGAFNEFAALGDALTKCADVYEETDSKSAKSLDEIAGS